MTDPAATGVGGRRRHPALGARIAATGVSISALIAVFGGIVQDAVAGTQPAPSAVASSVVVAANPAPPTPAADPVAPADLVTTREPVSLVAPPPTAPPPVAQTNGSR